MLSKQRTCEAGTDPTFKRFQLSRLFPGVALLWLVLLLSGIAFQPAAAGTPNAQATFLAYSDQLNDSHADTGGPANGGTALNICEKDLLDVEALFPAGIDDDTGETPVATSADAYSADMIRRLLLIDQERSRSIWLAYRSPTVKIADGSPRLYARPPPSRHGVSRTAGL